MIDVGKKYCPVCVSNNGTGDEPTFNTGHQAKHINPCRYPWQTPIGVLAEDISPDNTEINAEVMLSGTFDLYWNNTSGADQDIYGCGKNNSLIGVRVYYDAVNAMYICEHGTNADTSTMVYYLIGTYPGSATIGYISAVREDTAHDDAGWVTVTIDPRPARATYRVANYDGSGVLGWIGTPVVVSSPYNEASEYDPDEHTTCDGVVAGYVKMQVPESKYQVVICTSGPAWIFPSQSQLYQMATYQEIVAGGYSSGNVPITAILSFAPLGASNTLYPRIGYAHMDKWYNYDTIGVQYRMIIDIDLEAPTILEFETNNTNNQKGD